jgi:hypothetical protein
MNIFLSLPTASIWWTILQPECDSHQCSQHSKLSSLQTRFIVESSFLLLRLYRTYNSNSSDVTDVKHALNYRGNIQVVLHVLHVCNFRSTDECNFWVVSVTCNPMWHEIQTDVYRFYHKWHVVKEVYLRECIQKFPDWPPGARTANGTTLCH